MSLVILIIKANKMHYSSHLFLIKNSNMSGTDLLSIIRSLNTVYTPIGICHASYVDYLLARSGSIQDLAFIIRIYHDAWSCECLMLCIFEEILPDGKGRFCCISVLCDALMATFNHVYQNTDQSLLQWYSCLMGGTNVTSFIPHIDVHRKWRADNIHIWC